MKMKPVLLKLHRWVGLAICLWAAGVALSGTLLAFREKIESLVYPGSFLLASPPGPANFDKMVESITARYPDRQIVVFHRDGVNPDEAMHINLTRRATATDPVDIQDKSFNALFDADIEVFLNPATGEIVGERPFLNWMHIVYDFHTTLLAPINGKSYMGLLGLALFFILISGIVYWWPRANWFWRSFRVTTDRGPRRFMRDIHTVGGAVTLVFLVLSVGSGVLMCYEGPIQSALREWGIARHTFPKASTPAPPGTRFITPQQAADATDAAYPDSDIVLMYPPSAGRGKYLVQVFPRHESRIWWTVEGTMDAVTGKFLSAFDPHHQPWANSYVLWIIFFHNGQMFGATGQFVVMMEGIVMLMLCVTGPWVWVLGKRRSGAKARATKTAPVPAAAMTRTMS
jgi:uncharacterized iron-regulated membrane protein